MRTPPDFGETTTPTDSDKESSLELEKKPLYDGSHQKIAKQDKVKLWRKLTYAIGSIPYSMCNTVIGFYFSIFLLEVAILDPTYVLIIVFTGRVWDAITDPLVGFLCSLTKTRLGRLRPWMISAALPAGLVYTFLWFAPDTFDYEEGYVKFIYYLLLYFAFQALLTCIHVPYTALTMHMSHDNKERDSVTLYRICFEVSGTLLGILIYTVYYIGFVGATNAESCESGGERKPDYRRRLAFLCHSITAGILVVLFITTTFLGVREQKDEMNVNKRINFFRGIKEVFSFKPYVLLLLLELFSWLAVQFVQGNIALYVKYSVGLEDQYPYVIAVLLLATIAWMPFWQFIILRFGKKTAFAVGMWIFMPTILCLLFVPFYKYLMYPLALIGGMGVSCAYLLPWSMLPDVVDEAALEREVRREELFYAYFVFGNKFAGGVTLGISTAIYKIVGYDEEKCDQPWAFPLTLKLLVSVPPIFFILIALIFLHFYPVNKRSIEKTKQLLAARRKLQAAKGTGESYQDTKKDIRISQRSQEPYKRINRETEDSKQTHF